VGGIREKLLAAQRSGARTVIFPEANRIDVEGLGDDPREGLEVVLACDIASVADRVLA
jgi:ATP-dependent Lon protease